jgi:PmbA protein
MAFDTEHSDTLDRLLSAARAQGADAAEASVSDHQSLSVEVRLGALEGVEREESRSLALRALIGKRQAGAATTDLSPAGLAALAERVVAMAKAAPEDPFCGLADEACLAKTFPDLDTEDSARPDAKALEAMARACEDASRAVKGVTNSAGGGADFNYGAFAYATSTGFRGGARGTSYSMGATPLAEQDGQK